MPTTESLSTIKTELEAIKADNNVINTIASIQNKISAKEAALADAEAAAAAAYDSADAEAYYAQKKNVEKYDAELASLKAMLKDYRSMNQIGQSDRESFTARINTAARAGRETQYATLMNLIDQIITLCDTNLAQAAEETECKTILDVDLCHGDQTHLLHVDDNYFGGKVKARAEALKYYCEGWNS